jgi:hypothetical protein
MSTTSTTSKSRSAPPSGVNTKEEIQNVAANNYRGAKGHAFAFSHCVDVLHQLSKFNPMVDDDHPMWL